MSLVRYLWHALRYPALIPYTSMGLGIEARYSRCKTHWDSHLRKTKEFITKELSALPEGASVAIVGAGRLYDVPTQFLIDKKFRISCFDADPGARSHAKKLLPDATHTIVELSGTLSLWKELLTVFLFRHPKPTMEEVRGYLRNLSPIEVVPQIGSFDATISLNLLGQIPLYWRDVAASLLSKYLKMDAEEEIFFPSMGALQKQHLLQMQSCSKKKMVLIYDKRFQYEPVQAEPYEEEALHIPIDSIIETPWTLSATDSWVWDIAPEGVEQEGFSVSHTIEARSYSK